MEPLGHGYRPLITRRDLLRAAAVSPVLLSLLPTGCTPTQSIVVAPQGTPSVRVLVLENRSRVDLRATEPPTVRVGAAAPARVAVPTGSAVPVLHTGAGWKVGEQNYGSGELTIESAAAGSVSVDGRAYRGNYRFVPRAGGKIDVVNDVDVDGYLMGVVAKEMYPNWNDEAYRAQAVVARTYSLYLARSNSAAAHYDLFADTRSQMYGGIAGESAKSRSAIEDTRGWVVAYGPQGDARIFKAYYSSCCGGVTQCASAAFGEPDIEPLTEQRIGPRCAASTKFSWPDVVVSKAEVTRRLRLWAASYNESVRSIGNVVAIDVLTVNHFGRPSSFTATDSRGYRYRLSCEELRVAINTDATDGGKLFSSFCQPVNEASSVRFTDGHGFGHGVGMCQWCAQVQASAGASYTQIVSDAFPKAVLVKAY